MEQGFENLGVGLRVGHGAVGVLVEPGQRLHGGVVSARHSNQWRQPRDCGGLIVVDAALERVAGIQRQILQDPSRGVVLVGAAAGRLVKRAESPGEIREVESAAFGEGFEQEQGGIAVMCLVTGMFSGVVMRGAGRLEP